METTKSAVQEDLRAGETGRVEFKSTLRWNLKSSRIQDHITHAAMKAIAGFMNKRGGALYIGVDPSGVPRGLREDGYKDDDQFTRLLIDTVKQYLGQIPAVLLGVSYHSIDGHRLLRVDCPAATEPVFLRRNQHEEFWVRAETETIQLAVSKIHAYITERFGQPEHPSTGGGSIPRDEFRRFIRLAASPAEAFRRFGQDVQSLVTRGKWVFNISIGEPAEMAEAETRLRNALYDFRGAVLAARTATTDISGTEAIYDSLGDALKYAEKLEDLQQEIRRGLTVSALEADERYLGFLGASQVSVGEIRRRFEPTAPSSSTTDYWSMSDGDLEKLAAKYNIPPWGRAGEDGEHWYVDRDRVIATLVERDRHLAGNT
jgi:hypothetical protein